MLRRAVSKPDYELNPKPVKIPQIPSNRDYKAPNTGTVGRVGNISGLSHLLAEEQLLNMGISGLGEGAYTEIPRLTGTIRAHTRPLQGLLGTIAAYVAVLGCQCSFGEADLKHWTSNLPTKRDGRALLRSLQLQIARRRSYVRLLGLKVDPLLFIYLEALWNGPWS